MEKTTEQIDTPHWQTILQTYIPVLILLFFFLVGVKSLESGITLMGAGFADGLLTNTSNTMLALMSGMLATVLVQSSSVTTSIMVGLVGSGVLSVETAVPMVMGANLGTSVTNTLVSLSYAGNSKSFARAFSAGTIHDFFNILGVVILLPIEMATGILAKTATYLSEMLYGASSGLEFSSPIKTAIKPFVKGIELLITKVIGLQEQHAGIAMTIISAVIILLTLALIVKVTKKLVESSRSEILERVLVKNPYVSVAFGTALTFAVQSSSITTSLLVPMAASCLLSLESIFSVTVGANIGTTATAILASLAGNVHGLTIALVHLLFNIFSTLIWFVPPVTRQLPLFLAKKLGELTMKSRTFGFAYVGIVFFALPISCYLLFR